MKCCNLIGATTSYSCSPHEWSMHKSPDPSLAQCMGLSPPDYDLLQLFKEHQHISKVYNILSMVPHSYYGQNKTM